MRLIRINEGKMGLVFRKGDYQKCLTAGMYWVRLTDTVLVYDMTRPFIASVELNILLKDEELASHLDIVEAADGELILMYENKNLKTVYQAGRYAFWKGLVKYEFKRIDLSKTDVISDVDQVVLERRELHPYIRVQVVDAFEKGALFVDGQFVKMLTAGTYFFWKNATPIKVLKVDMRQQLLELPGQEILTRDKAGLRINFQALYKVVEVEKTLIDNKDFEKQLYTQLQLALRELVGTLTLDEILDRKMTIAESVMETVREKASALGVKVIDCGVRDIILPGEVREIMNQVLVAEKKAEANTIMRREETASTRSLLNTARLMEDNEMLYKLKEMEYVEKIADKINTITVSGGGQVVDQLKAIFAPSK